MAFVNGITRYERTCFYVTDEDISGNAHKKLKHQLTSCAMPYFFHFLCEFGAGHREKASDRRSQTLLPPTLTANSTKPPIDHVTCPGGHVTHKLYACDAQASCWAERGHVQVDLRGSPGKRSCPAPVTPLPPSFSCQGGLQVVAYTVVCDHRPDCADGSDEDFCVFPPCQRGAEIACNNQQVSLGQCACV